MTAHHQTSSSFGRSLPSILFLMTMVFFGMIPRLLISPLLLRISGDLGITYDRASIFFLTASAGFVVGLLTSGFIARALTHRWTIFVSVFVGGAAMIALSRSNTLPFFHAMLFVGGYVNGLYPGSGVVSVLSIAPQEHHGKALAVHESGPNLAFIMAPILSAILAPIIGWRGTMMVVGIGAVAIALIFAAFGNASRDRGQAPNFSNLAELVKNRAFWVVSALFIVAAVAAMGVYAVLPTYLILEHGMSERVVNTLIGASRVTAFAAILVAGGLTDRFGFKKVVLVILVVTGIATAMLGIAKGWLLGVAVFVQPMIVGSYFPVGLNALAGVTSPARRNVAVALAIPLANLVGSGLAPLLLSALGGAGHFQSGFIATGILTVATLALLPLMDRRRHRTDRSG